MRKLLLVSLALLSLTACQAARFLPVGGPAPASQGVSADRVGPYVAVIRYLTEVDRSPHQYVETAVCSPKQTTPACADLSQEEQAGIMTALSDEGTTVRMVDPAGAIAVRKRVFKGQASLVTFGATKPYEDGLSIYAWIGCGSLCGTGASWLATPDGDGWVVNGPVPGTGVAIS